MLSSIAASRTPLMRATILVAGLLLTQFILYGQSIIGARVLLPLDILHTPGACVPASIDRPFREPTDGTLADPVNVSEPDRLFSIRELRQGRIPLWTPLIYAGTPFMASQATSVFSPFRLIEFASENPIVLAWSQLARTLVAGIGAYLFFGESSNLPFGPRPSGHGVTP